MGIINAFRQHFNVSTTTGFGAIQDDELIYQMGKEFARQFLRMGIHVNFAPVVDVNNNANNPVINSRSFGENPILVAQKGYAYMRGMEENGLMSSAKHFPDMGIQMRIRTTHCL